MEFKASRFIIELVSEEVKARLQKQTIRTLETTLVPRYAFIVVEVPKYTARRGMDGGKYERSVNYGLAFLNVEDQPGQGSYLQHLTGKRGCKLIAYGGFPTHDSTDATIRRKYDLYSNPESGNPWDNLKALCNNLLVNAPVGADERIGYQKELEELKRKLAEKEATNELERNDTGEAKAGKRSRKSKVIREESGDEGELGLSETSEIGA